ncbi:hypothetical protein NQD34_008819 [Periophthalmus magnuspinnatus]|nr:hypothetical protein NQD34_008819 [Periophthalmus magnuspinnatus]
MHYFVLVTLLAASALLASAEESDSEEQNYSFSELVGSRSGTSFRITGEERLTAVRTWDNGAYIYAIQVRYGGIWSERVGSETGQMQEILLEDDEAVIQVSGKYSTYINWLVFVTNKGRSMFAGQPAGTSFNMYPEHQGAELRFISGTSLRGALTGFATHWAVYPQESKSEEH